MKKTRLALVIITLILLSACATSPKGPGPIIEKPSPAVNATRWLFSLFPYSLDENYAQYKSNITIIEDIDYQSAYPNGFLDIIRPTVIDGSEKLIFWVHGGGFIYGDKKEIEHYFVHLANEGFVTININYVLSPEYGNYPMPVKQIEEAYCFIKNHAAEYGLNLDQVYFGGDSAGGHIIAQFVTMQTNDAYRALMNSSTPIQFETVVDRDTLRGALFFCALFDVVEMSNPPPDAMRLPLREIGEAYFRTSDLDAEIVRIAGVIDKVDENFPPTFITDGNLYSIEWEAKEFAAALIALGVETEAVFFEKKEARLYHEYQFDMANPHALQTYKQVIEFLRK
jgi:acetyl esterase/lipase